MRNHQTWQEKGIVNFTTTPRGNESMSFGNMGGLDGQNDNWAAQFGRFILGAINWGGIKNNELQDRFKSRASV
jgi:hypothetical protein